MDSSDIRTSAGAERSPQQRPQRQHDQQAGEAAGKVQPYVLYLGAAACKYLDGLVRQGRRHQKKQAVHHRLQADAEAHRRQQQQQRTQHGVLREVGQLPNQMVRSGQGPVTVARSMSGGNQQKAIVAREIDKDPELLVAVQPTRGLDVGAIEYIHSQLVAERDKGKAVLLVSLELDEVMDVPDRILVMYEGEIVGELDPKKTTQEELGLYMAGVKRDEVTA